MTGIGLFSFWDLGRKKTDQPRWADRFKWVPVFGWGVGCELGLDDFEAGLDFWLCLAVLVAEDFLSNRRGSSG